MRAAACGKARQAGRRNARIGRGRTSTRRPPAKQSSALFAAGDSPRTGARRIAPKNAKSRDGEQWVRSGRGNTAKTRAAPSWIVTGENLYLCGFVDMKQAGRGQNFLPACFHTHSAAVKMLPACGRIVKRGSQMAAPDKKTSWGKGETV